MRRVSWRWALVAAMAGTLVAVPALAGALPAEPSQVTAPELLQRVRGSAAVGFSGYAESRGGLVLPDVEELGELPGLFGATTRTRVWWRGPADWRVDALTLVGERDVAVDPAGSWDWASADRRAVRLQDRLDVRLPQPGDLVAPVLARRLAGAANVAVSRLPATRVAGRSAAGMRLVPQDPTSTTVARVDMWVDAPTGLALRVEVYAAGEPRPSLESALLDVSVKLPARERTAFAPPAQVPVVGEEAPDIAALVDRLAPFVLPDRLAGLPRRQRVTALPTGGGVGTYGDGLTTLVVVPLPGRVARQAMARIDPAGSGEAVQVSTPLVNAVIGTERRLGYLIVGTVPLPLVERALASLLADPPRRLRQ